MGDESTEVERLREQNHRLEEQVAGMQALLASYTGQVQTLREDLDAEITERGARRIRADRDRMTIDLLRRTGAEHFADAVKMRATVDRMMREEADRVLREAETLRLRAWVIIANPQNGEDTGRRGIIVGGPAPVTRSWLVWWCDEQDADAGTALWERPERLAVLG